MYWVMGILPFFLLLLGFPIFLLLLVTSLVILVGFFNVPMTVLHQIIFNSLNKYPLLAVPFFVFAGDLMSRGGITERLLRWVASLIGGFRAHRTIWLTSLLVTVLCGVLFLRVAYVSLPRGVEPFAMATDVFFKIPSIW